MTTTAMPRDPSVIQRGRRAVSAQDIEEQRRKLMDLISQLPDTKFIDTMPANIRAKMEQPADKSLESMSRQELLELIGTVREQLRHYAKSKKIELVMPGTLEMEQLRLAALGVTGARIAANQLNDERLSNADLLWKHVPKDASKSLLGRYDAVIQELARRTRLVQQGFGKGSGSHRASVKKRPPRRGRNGWGEKFSPMTPEARAASEAALARKDQSIKIGRPSHQPASKTAKGAAVPQDKRHGKPKKAAKK